MEIHKKILSIFTLFFLLFSQLSVFADEMGGDEGKILLPSSVLGDDVIDSEDSDIKYFFQNDGIYYGKKKDLYSAPGIGLDDLRYLYYIIPLKTDLNKTLSGVYDLNGNEFLKFNSNDKVLEKGYEYDAGSGQIKLWAKSFYDFNCIDSYCYDSDSKNYKYKYNQNDYSQNSKNITIEFTDGTKTTFPFRFYLPNFTIQNQVSQDGVIIGNNSQDIILNFENIDELHFNSSEYNVNNIDTNFYGNDTVSFSGNSMILHDSIDDSATTDIRVIFGKNFDNFIFNYTTLYENYCNKKDIFLYNIKDNSIYLDGFTNNYTPNAFVGFDFDLYKFINNSFVKIEDNNYTFENSFTKIDTYSDRSIAGKLTLNNLNDGIYKIIGKNVESKYSNICSEYFNKDKKSIFYEDTFNKFNLTFIKSGESISKYDFSLPDIDDIFSIGSQNTISSIDYNLAKNINITISSYSGDTIKSYSKDDFEKEGSQYKVNFNNTEINNYFTSKGEKNKVVKFNYFYEKLDGTSDQREYLYLLKSNIYFPWYNEYTYFGKISLAGLNQYDLYQIIFKSQDGSIIAELNKDDYTQKSLEYGMDYMYLKSDYEKYIKDLLINYYLNTGKEIIVEKNKKMSDGEIVTTTNSIVLQPDFSLSNFDFNPNYLKNITTINNLFNYFEGFSNYKNFNLTFKDQNGSTLKSFSSNDYYLNGGDAIYLKKNYNELFDFFKGLYLEHNDEEISIEVDYTDINGVQDTFTRKFTISYNISFSNILNEYSLRNIGFSNIDSFDNIYKTATGEIVYSKNNLSPEIFNDGSEYQIYYEIINNLKDYSKNNDFYVDFKSDYIVRKKTGEVVTLPLIIEGNNSFNFNFIDNIGGEGGDWGGGDECPPGEKCGNNSLKIVDNIGYSLEGDNYIEFPTNYLDNAGILNIDFITSSGNILSIEKEDFECEGDYCGYYFDPESNPLGNLGDQTLVNMQVYYKDVNGFEDNFVTKFYVINNENSYNIYELGSDIDLSDVFYDYDNLDFNIDKSYYTTSNNFSIKIYDYADNLIRDINKNDFNCDKGTCEYNNQSDLDNLSGNIYHIVINYTDLLGKNYNLDEYINIGDDYSFYLDFTTKIEKDGQKYFYFSPDFESDNIYIEEDGDDKNLRYKYYNWYDASIDIGVKLLHSGVETNLEVDKDIYKVGDLLKFVFNDEKINTDSKIIFYNLNNEDDIFYVINLGEYLDKVDNLNYLSKDNDNKTLSVSHYNIDKPSSNYLFGRKINLSANNDNQYSYGANYVYSLGVNISGNNIGNVDKSKLLVCYDEISEDDDISNCDTLEDIESTQKSFDNFTIYMYGLKGLVDSNFDSIKIDFNFDVLVSYNLG